MAHDVLHGVAWPRCRRSARGRRSHGSTTHPSLLDPLDRAVDDQVLSISSTRPAAARSPSSGERWPASRRVGLEPSAGAASGRGRGWWPWRSSPARRRLRQKGAGRPTLVDTPPGTPDLLVVRHRRGGEPTCMTKPRSGFRSPCPRGGGDRRLEPVAAQSVLEPLPLSGSSPPVRQPPQRRPCRAVIVSASAGRPRR